MRPTKSKAVAVIDGQIKLQEEKLREAEEAVSVETSTLTTLKVVRDQIIKALAARKKPEKVSKTTPVVTPLPIARDE